MSLFPGECKMERGKISSLVRWDALRNAPSHDRFIGCHKLELRKLERKEMVIRNSLSFSPSSSSCSFIAVRAYFNGASKPRFRLTCSSSPASSLSRLAPPPSRVYRRRNSIGRRYTTSTSTMSTNDALPTTPEALEAEIAVQTARFNDLRLNADKSVATPEALADAKKRLADLKKALGQAKAAGKEKKPKAEGAAAAQQPAQGEKKKERLLLKTAKVCRHPSLSLFIY